VSPSPDDSGFDTSNVAWLIEGDPTPDRIDPFNEIFGNDDFVKVLYDAGDFFQPGPMARLEALTRALEDEVPHLLAAAWPEAGIDPLAGWIVD
jgi:hypothetical protein